MMRCDPPFTADGAREAFALMKLQRSGTIVFIGSKNAVAATVNAAAYASAKAAALRNFPGQHDLTGAFDRYLQSTAHVRRSAEGLADASGAQAL